MSEVTHEGRYGDKYRIARVTLQDGGMTYNIHVDTRDVKRRWSRIAVPLTPRAGERWAYVQMQEIALIIWEFHRDRGRWPHSKEEVFKTSSGEILAYVDQEKSFSFQVEQDGLTIKRAGLIASYSVAGPKEHNRQLDPFYMKPCRN